MCTTHPREKEIFFFFQWSEIIAGGRGCLLSRKINGFLKMKTSVAMGSKVLSWPCGCMSEGFMYCGRSVTALFKPKTFWMQNLAGPSTNTQGLCQYVQKSIRIGRNSVSLPPFFLVWERGYFKESLPRSMFSTRNKRKTLGYFKENDGRTVHSPFPALTWDESWFPPAR